MSEKMNVRNIEIILEFLAFLSSSAQGLFGEPHEYGPLRCVDAIRRFIDLIFKLDVPLDEKFIQELKELRSWIDRDMHLLMYDREKFREFVNNLTKTLAEIALRYLT
ncbi:MAG: hypothetical protein JHC19_07115 [Desulfurococcaceae archaeon]|nr:hypothetical protein [Desulfurococcaceae archaeon]